MEIKRDKLLGELLAARGNGMVKIITGIRRSGKSYLLFKIFADHLKRHEGVSERRLVTLALDDRRNQEYRNPDRLLEYLDAHVQRRGKTYVLLDEVQMVDDFADVLNSLLHYDNVEVYVTGSNSRFLSKDIATIFRGRGHEIHVDPLSFSEFMQVHDAPRDEALLEYMTYGGLPQVVTMNRSKDKRDYLNNIFANTYLIDILERYKIQSGSDMEDLINVVASGIGGLTNPARLENTFATVKRSKISAVTIKRYLEMLEDAFLIEKAIRYDIKGKRYIGTPCKYYFTDLGLRNALLHFRQFEETHIMENLLYNELRRRCASVDVGVCPLNTKDAQGTSQRIPLEVDFVCNSGHSRIYIQSAYHIANRQKLAQELRPLLAIKDAFAKVVITMDRIPRHYDENGVLMLNLYDFLLDETALALE